MSEKFNNKYRSGSHRFPGWNYAGDGVYYITLVTQGRECHLGYIENGEMHLSHFGNIANNEWLKSFELRSELFLDKYVIMPNHIHAIVVLVNRDGTGRNDGGCGTHDNGDGCGTHDGDGCRLHDGDGCRLHDGDGCGLHDGDGCRLHDGDGCGLHVETHGRASLQSSHEPPRQSSHESPHRLPKSISSFMAGFKSSVNTKIDDYIDRYDLNIPKFNRHNPFFQKNYHDRVIRNRDEYWRIKKYIIQNPANWQEDVFRR